MALTGNLCRCTGYRPIRDAAHSLGPPQDDRFRQRLSRATPRLGELSIAGFSRPTSVDACLSLLRDDPGGRLVAGATDLAVESNLRLRRWPHLVSLDAIDELREFSSTPDHVRIGAAIPQRDWPHRRADAFERTHAVCVAAVRNRATLGAISPRLSPRDAAPCCWRSTRLSISLAIRPDASAGRLLSGLSENSDGAREIITAVEIPPLPQFVRFTRSRNEADDISTVAAAIGLDDAQGRVRRARSRLAASPRYSELSRPKPHWSANPGTTANVERAGILARAHDRITA
jgi:xanthine dehydrogenase small subunit